MNAPETQQQPPQQSTLEEQVIEALRGVYDPEIPVNIYDLGLIYALDIDADGVVNIVITSYSIHYTKLYDLANRDLPCAPIRS